MTTHSEVLSRPRSGTVTAMLIVMVPIALALVCVLARFDIIELSQSVRATLLFALLLALMATGMPISIALGLSVLTYLFILSSVDPKMVGLKLRSEERRVGQDGKARGAAGQQYARQHV